MGELIEREQNGIKFFTSELLEPQAEVQALVTTRHGGVSTGPFATLNLGGKTADDPQNVTQSHSANIAQVPRGYEGGAFDDVDALITDAKQTPLVILTADCAAVFLYDAHNHAIGLVHAGWRGTVAGIAADAVRRMHAAFGTFPHDIIACIGPSIGPCCYEVGDEVINAVSETLPEYADEVLVEPDMASAGSFRESVNAGRKHFDLWRANEIMLADVGVPETQIEVARLCTSCRTDIFYSHRAEKGITGRFGGFMMLK